MSPDEQNDESPPTKHRRVEAEGEEAAPVPAPLSVPKSSELPTKAPAEPTVSQAQEPQTTPAAAAGEQNTSSQGPTDMDGVMEEGKAGAGVSGVADLSGGAVEGVTGGAALPEVTGRAAPTAPDEGTQGNKAGMEDDVAEKAEARASEGAVAKQEEGATDGEVKGCSEEEIKKEVVKGGENGEGGAPQSAPLVTQGAYGARESFFQQQEETGEISFVYIENDGSQQNNIWLIGLKNIFSKQLPNMPKEYITRLVLNRRHRSVGIVKPDDKDTVLGGITYRAFHSQGFGEIAFCAITATEQVKGYGTRLMNFTKEYAKTKDHLTHFLTYADNNAVGYFTKQGFTKEITLSSDRWTGFIKDYDGGTLMECVMHPKICFTNFPEMLKKQRKALETRIRKQSNSHIVHPGLKGILRDGVRQPIRVEDIPGVKEAGWEASQDSGMKFMLVLDGTAVPPTLDNLQKFFHITLVVMMSNEDAWPFLEPVDANDVPDYYEIIKDPVDMSLIKQRLESRTYYLTLDIFTADFKRMFSNCRIYNAADTIYAKLATKLEAYFHHYFSKSVMMQT